MTSLRARRGPVRGAGWVLAVVGCLLWAVVTAAPSYAHDQLRSTNPADGMVLEQAPSQLEMTYNADILPIASLAILRDGAGNDIPTGDPVVDGKTLTLAWPAGMGGGDYAVVWRVVSSDGHPIQGTFSFTVQAAAAPAGSGAVASDPAASGPAVSEPVPTPSASATATPATATPNTETSSTETTASSDAAPAASTSDENGSGPSTAVMAGGALLLVLVVAALLVFHHRRAARTHGS
ncbi:copper resistance protein CopC [Kineococcus sp. R86509]|uniref:copper resistance CopC family protein n=1 Tax=Kineococcus sp. R86509 TaxID=3093851 RepID=UPI0036D3BAD3